jgi:plastocyanin
MVYKTLFRVTQQAGIGAFFIAVTIGFIHLILINSSITIERANAEQKITIIPDAHSNTAIRFVDVKNYFLQVGEELTWFNDDFVDHTLVLMNEDNTTRIADLDLPSNSSATYTFGEHGKYYYSSKDYRKIQGSVKVVDPDDISVEKITGLKNGVDVQLAWTPSHILLNPINPASDKEEDVSDKDGTQTGEADFLITFINNDTGTNQEHIDYDYSINDVAGNGLFSRASHSTYGIEEGRYEFNELGRFDAQIMITHILFAPVDPDIAKFHKVISVS